ncbi:MAG: aminotransferase class V-fold PLP-dependent enzyme [Microbacteriaceae bacterium]|nr:aminotransferase class V-fold PLP-dependent enzyme [Microbacteriaceae bacterium]
MLHSELLDRWRAFAEQPGHPFTIPGHKHRAGEVWPELGAVNDGDVPLFGGIGPMKQATAVLAEAEARTAAAWGADWCRYGTGGSTQANQAVALAVGQPGDEVLVVRNAHRSLLSGLIMAGLTPIWLTPDVADGLLLGIAPETVRAAIEAHPRAKALFLVEPSYVGTMSDREAIIRIAHDAGIPVVVDQAWGAHLGFHEELPAHALAIGADALVFSAHKTLPAYSQASIVFARTERLDPDRLERGFEAGNTTSPAGSILASIDAATILLRSPEGHALLGDLLGRAENARQRLRAAGLTVPGPETHRMDPAKLVVRLPHGGGLAIERRLLELGLGPEQAEESMLVPILTMLDDPAAVERLVDVIVEEALRLAALAQGARPGSLSEPKASRRDAVARPPLPPARMTPRDAFFAPHATVAAAAALGRISTEIIAPYPPGIPVLVPGEEITEATLTELRAARAAGVRIAYAADATLETFQVVAGSHS